MRNYTTKYIKEKLGFTTKFNLNPFPGKYPTRVLVARIPLNAKWYEFDSPLYIGKPNLIVLGKLANEIVGNILHLEFDKKNFIYARHMASGRSVIRNSPSFAFYHPYVAINQNFPWPWFLTKWHSLKVKNHFVYSIYEPNHDSNLTDGLLDMLKDQKENVGL